jgi:hypothetical protein
MSNDTTSLNREDITKQEVGQTDVPRWLSIMVTLVFLVLIALETDGQVADVAPTPDRPVAMGALPLLCAEIVKDTEETVVVGKDGWAFLRSELRHLSVGPFWGDAAQTVSKASTASKKDPLPAIVDYHKRLQALGIELYFMPIPAKAAVYPDKLPGELDWSPTSKTRLDTVHQEFYQELEKQGVKVIDLMPLLLEARSKADAQLYCRRDSHYSAEACELIAQHLAKRFKDAPWLADATAVEFKAARKELSINGDLGQISEEESIRAPETIALRVITGAELKDPNSPLLLFGDSHNLVFDIGGEMHATGAGLPSQLAYELGIGVDVMGIFGSGATSSRVNIFRRASREADFLKQKKIFIWCLSAREFSEGRGWSAKVPVAR